MFSKDRKSNVRMDSLENTVIEYGQQLYQFNRQLKQTKDKKASLQETLLSRRKETSQLRAEVESLKAKKKELEEREKSQAVAVKDLEAQVDCARSKLEQQLQLETELQNLANVKIREIETESRQILYRFQNLKLKDSNEQLQEAEDAVLISQQIPELEEEIAVLKEERDSLVQKENAFPTDALQQIISECEASLLTMKGQRSILEDKSMKLKADLKQLDNRKKALTEARFSRK